MFQAWADPEGRGRGQGPRTPWKVTSGYMFPYKYWYGPPREAFGPKRSNCSSREVRTTLCEIR